ncbi:hypothetical protein ZWY2020_004143 [Hordeum vulgare]|nr:hypothetical protein ZWY2020_004143 [Hordeum vulgare]
MPCDDASAEVGLEGEVPGEKVEETQDRTDRGTDRGMDSRTVRGVVRGTSKTKGKNYFRPPEIFVIISPLISKPTQQNARAHRSSYASADNDESLSLPAEELIQNDDPTEDKNKE